jgi:hypothetical protein
MDREAQRGLITLPFTVANRQESNQKNTRKKRKEAAASFWNFCKVLINRSDQQAFVVWLSWNFVWMFMTCESSLWMVEIGFWASGGCFSAREQ